VTRLRARRPGFSSWQR